MTTSKNSAGDLRNGNSQEKELSQFPSSV